MKRSINPEELQSFINEHYKSKVEFSKSIGISYSHLDKLLKGKTKLGAIVFSRLEEEGNSQGVDIESLLDPTPIAINGQAIREILVTKDGEILVTKDGGCIVSITSTSAITKEGYKVKCVPY